MLSLKNVLIFLAGAAFFHALSHIMVPFFINLPLEVKGITLTSTLNNWIIGINLFITVGLLWLASRVKS